MADDRERILIEIDAEDNASSEINKVSKSINNLGKSGDGLNSASSNISSFITSLEKGIGKVNHLTRQYNNSMRGINTAVINTIKDMGSAVFDFTSDSIDNFTKFSEQHARTLGAMAADYDNTAASRKKFFDDSQKLKSQAFDIGTYGINHRGSLSSVSDVSLAQESLVKAGISPDVITGTDALKEVLKFAQANSVDIDSAVSTAVTLGNQFQIKPKDWGLMLDKISHTADMSIVEVSDIVQSLKWASGVSAGLNRGFEETLGTISVLGDFGLKGSQAGTGVQALLTRLLTGDTTVITQAQAKVAPGKALEKFYEFESIAKPNGNLLPMNDVINQMNLIMEDMTDEEQAWFAKKLFGLYQMKAAYALMNGDDVSLNDVIKEIKTMSEGTNENKLQQLLDSQYGQLTSLTNLLDGIKTDMGDKLSPFVDAVRDELFTFLSKDGHYKIDFGRIHDSLDEACDLIEQKYGSAVANAVRGIGDYTIDLTHIMVDIGPEFGSGMSKFLKSLFSGDIFGNGGAISDWGDMIDKMHESADELPEDLRDLGNAVVGCIDWFGKLMALNVASEIAEIISSVMQILTIAGGAVINVAGGVIVNGTAVGGAGAAAGSAGAAVGGAGSSIAKSGLISGKTVVGSADDVARMMGTSADDVVATFGKSATYTIDDLAKGLGSSTDDVIKSMSGEIDDLIKAGVISVDDVAIGGSKLFGALSKTGKVLGATGMLFQAGMGGYSAYKNFSTGNNKEGVGDLTGTGLSIIGGVEGAAMGTAIAPGVGTVIGAVAGSLGGDFAGRGLGESAYEMFHYGTTGIGKYDSWKRNKNENDLLLADIKSGAPALSELGSRLKELKVGNLSAKDWTLQLAKDNGWKKYQKLAENEKQLFDQAFQEIFKESYSQFRSRLGLDMTENEKQSNRDSLGNKMILINKNNDKTKGYYDKSMDTLNQGYYNVWTGTQAELSKYLASRGDRLVDKNYSKRATINGATEDNPYMFDGLSEKIKQAIIDGFGQVATNNKNNIQKSPNIAPYKDYSSYMANNKGSNVVNPFSKIAGSIDSLGLLNRTGSLNISGYTSPKQIEQASIKLPDNITSQNTTIASTSTNFTGEVKIPNIIGTIKQQTIPGMISAKGAKDIISNNVKINDAITMSPHFSVAAPNVKVDVKVDKSGGVTKTMSILNPQQGVLLNNWYSRTSSQYGSTTK